MKFKIYISIASLLGTLLASCSMESELPIFLSTDGDYIGHRIKVLGLQENGKPISGNFEVNPNSDGSYIVTSEIPPKYDDRYVLKAIKRVDGGVIYAVQFDMAPRFPLETQISKRIYEIYPVQISSSGEIIIFEFLKNKKTENLAKKYKLKIRQTSLSIRIEGDFDQLVAQCYVQELIERNLYKPLNDKKESRLSFSGHQTPNIVGIEDCN